MKMNDKELKSQKNRTLLINHFRGMDKESLVSFISCWLKDSEINQIVKTEGLDINKK